MGGFFAAHNTFFIYFLLSTNFASQYSTGVPAKTQFLRGGYSSRLSSSNLHPFSALCGALSFRYVFVCAQNAKNYTYYGL